MLQKLFVVCSRYFVILSLAHVAQGQSIDRDQSVSNDKPSEVQSQPLQPHPLVELRHLNSSFPFQVPVSLESWEKRRDRLKQDLLVSLGLWPMPPKTPLNAVIHGTVSMNGYTVSKVYFESMPGFFVTGNLYCPAEIAVDPDGGADPADQETKRLPGVLCPHGHFRDGRFTEATEAEIETELASGAEVFATNAKSILQSRCAQLAKMGCVVFHYDMIGYADSQQIPYSVAHGFVHRRKNLEQNDRWGFFSPQAELRLQSIMGLQTWNSIRALDFLVSLPDVDPQRLGVTGASGGGTQTFILGAIDDRPTVAFPAVMVSTAMQGGCTCENASHLRISAGNVDFAAMFAPRPIGLTAADDWTRNFQTYGFPQLQALYNLYGKPKNVQLTSRLEFGHNFNSVGRRAMYGWFHQHLALDRPLEDEEPIEFLSRDQLTVFNEDHPAPIGGEAFEAKLLRYWHQVTSNQLGLANDDAHAPSVNETETIDRRALGKDKTVDKRESNELLSKGWQSIIGHPEGLLSWTVNDWSDENTDSMKIWIHSQGHQLTTPVTILAGKSFDPQKILVAVSLADFHQLDHDHWRPWLDKGWTIMLPHLLYSGDLMDRENPPGENRLVPNGRYAAGYTFGYNRTVLAWRATQLIDVCRFFASEQMFFNDSGKVISIVADQGLEGLALMAISQIELNGDEIKRSDDKETVGLKIQMAFLGEEFRFDSIQNLEDSMFLPGAVRYGGMRGLFGLVSDYPTLVVTTGKEDQQQKWWANEEGLEIRHLSTDIAKESWPEVFKWLN